MNKALAFGVTFACLASVTGGAIVAQRLFGALPSSTSTPTPAALTTTPATEGTFTPPVGRATNPPKNSAGERRVNIATSPDGMTFVPTGEILTDQANVPDAVVGEDGTLYVYYIGQSITKNEEDTVVAVSKDDGATWTYHLLTFLDLPNTKPPSDPDVVMLPDGTFRMFYTCDFGPGALGIRYADSPDGFTFTHKGIALRPEINVIDSTTFRVGDTWTMLVLDEKDAKQYTATSTDGATFTLTGDVTLQTADRRMYFLANPIPGVSPTTLLGFSDPGTNIYRAFSTSDGEAWIGASTESMTGTMAALHDGTYLQDLSVAQISDGSYLLFYVTDIPK